MITEESKRIIQMYEGILANIKKFGLERQVIIKEYIKELEQKKIELLRHILNNSNHQ